jgi:CRISPR-associated protein Cmr3
MSLWTIEPRDPLVVRDGRPNNGRSESETLHFPYPSTIAGVVRTRLGSDERGVFDPAQDLASLLRARIHGPLLADADGGALYVPAPRDAVVFGNDDEERVLRRLVPSLLPADAFVDGDLDVAPVDFTSAPPSRKPGDPPAWWPWSAFASWLEAPAKMDGEDANLKLAGSLLRMPREPRVGVKITDTWTAEEGMLYQTRGLRLAARPWDSAARDAEETNPRLAARSRPLALAFDVDTAEAGGRALLGGIGPTAGERRLVRWQPAPQLPWPGLPAGVHAALGRETLVRVVLLTPAIFTAGHRPGEGAGQLLGERAGITPRLVAMCVPRPETISGWDFAKRQPKKTRRLVSAGSVFWLDLGGDEEARRNWAKEVMMSNVSDAEQDRRDGFGLAAVGVGS